MFLVIGAGGFCGGAVSRALVQRGQKVRAFCRTQKSAEAAKINGATDIFIGDLRDLTALEQAAKNVEGIFYIGGAFMPDEAELGKYVIDVAVKLKVKKFVYSSVLHPIASAMIHHDAKRRVEEHLIASNLDYTILQPARYMHGIFYSIKGILEDSAYREPFSAESIMSYVDYENIAEVAAICLTEKGYARASFQLCSEGELTRRKMCLILSEVLQKKIVPETIELDAWVSGLPKEKLSPYTYNGLLQMFRYYEKTGFRGGNGFVLRSILGREPTSYRQYIERIRGQLI